MSHNVALSISCPVRSVVLFRWFSLLSHIACPHARQIRAAHRESSFASYSLFLFCFVALLVDHETAPFSAACHADMISFTRNIKIMLFMHSECAAAHYIVSPTIVFVPRGNKRSCPCHVMHTQPCRRLQQPFLLLSLRNLYCSRSLLAALQTAEYQFFSLLRKHKLLIEVSSCFRFYFFYRREMNTVFLFLFYCRRLLCNLWTNASS